MINEAEQILKVAYRETLLLDAFSYPNEFNKAIDKVIVSPRSNGYKGGSTFDILGSSALGILGGIAAAPIGGVLGILPDGLELDASESLDGDSQVDRISERDSLHAAALGSKTSPDDHYLRNLSAKERKERFLKIPEKITASFEKQNPDANRFLNEVAGKAMRL